MHPALRGKTFAEVPLVVKNKYSHRARALKVFKAKFEAFIKEKK